MDEDEKLAYYLEIGVVSIAGVDENGEIIYQIHESAKDLAPELWEAHERYVDEGLVDLFNKGMLSVEYDENLEATITVTPEGMDLLKSYGFIDYDEE